MQRAVISTLCVLLAMGLIAGSPLFYERQKILNKVEFSDAGIDGARIDPLIDVSDEVEGNITVSSFTDTNDVGGNDSKEEDSSDGTVDEDVATERTATEATLNGDSNEAAENARKVTGTASLRPATFGTTKNSQTDPSNVQGDRESVTTPGSASSTTPGRVTNSTEENVILSGRQSTGVDATSEKTVQSSQMPSTHWEATTFETSTPPSAPELESTIMSSNENELDSTIKMIVNSATTTATETPEKNTDNPIDSSEDSTTKQSINVSLTTSSTNLSESNILTTTESTTPTESFLSATNEHGSVEETETITFMSTVEKKETTLSMSSLDGITNLIDTTTQPTTDAGVANRDDTTIGSTDATTSVFLTTLQVESSTLSSFTGLTTDSFSDSEFSETTVLHTTTSETTTSSSTPKKAIDSEESAEVSLGASNPTTVVTETTTMKIVPTTVISEEQRTTTEMQVNPPETTLGDAITTTPATVSSIEFSESSDETTANNVKPTTFTENVSAEIGVTSEATVSVTQTLEEMSTFVTVGHSLETGEFMTTSTVENVLTTNAIVEALTSTVAATTVLKSGSAVETSETSPDTTTTEVTTIALPTETASSTEATANTEADEEGLSTITSTVTNVQDTVITTTEMSVQDTTATSGEQTEETTTSVVLENFSTTTEITTTTTEEIIRETTIIAVTNIEENATIVADVDQSRTTSEMMFSESLSGETSNEATAAPVTYIPQEKFTEATTMVSQSVEDATNDEFKQDSRTTTEPSTTIDSGETSTGEIMENVSSTTRIVITTTAPTPEQISTVRTDSENTSEAYRSHSEESDSTTTEQIATLTSKVVGENTEKTHDSTTQEASTTAALDTTSVLFTEALTRTTEEFSEPSTTSVPDLGGFSTSTGDETTTQESTEELTTKRVVGQTEEMNSVFLNSVTTAASGTTLASTTLAIEGHEENSEDRFKPELNEGTMMTTPRSETITQESSPVSVGSTDPTTTMLGLTTSRSNIEELEKGFDDEISPQHTESTSSSSEMTTNDSSLVSVESTESTTTILGLTTSRSNIEELEKGFDDEISPQHTESTSSSSEMTTNDSSLVSVESTESTTILSVSTTSRNKIEEHEEGSEDATQHTESTSSWEITSKGRERGLVETTDPITTMSAPTTSRSNIEELENGSEDETSRDHTESTKPSEIATKESSRDSVETTIDYTTVTETTVQTTTSFTTSTIPSSVTVSEDQLSTVAKETPVASETRRKELTEVDAVGKVSLASEAMITTTVLPVTSSERPGHPNVSESVQRSTKNITPEQSDDIAGATILPEKELPLTSDALSTPAEDSGSIAHTIHHLLLLVPIVLVQLRSSLWAFT